METFPVRRVATVLAVLLVLALVAYFVSPLASVGLLGAGGVTRAARKRRRQPSELQETVERQRHEAVERDQLEHETEIKKIQSDDGGDDWMARARASADRANRS